MSPWMQITAWTLIHFVWQGGLIAVATAAGIRLCRRRSSEARYAIACAGLTAMLASPVITASFLWAPGSVLAAGRSALSIVPGSEATSSPQRITIDDRSSSTNGGAAMTRIGFAAFLSFVVWAWLAGVTLLLARFAGGCWRVHRLRVASLAEAVSQWQSSSERLAARLRLRVAFQVVESRLVDAPIVIGWIRPVILLPVAVLTNLAPGQIEAILAHELAHIRRRDYAVNLLQSVAETLLFYHPGVWWISAQVREAREHCCDDVAVEVCGEPTAYAAALVELASWRTRQIALSVAATDGPLLARVRRLLRVPDNEPRSISGLVILALGMLLAAGVAVQSSSFVASGATVIAPRAAVPAAPSPRLASRGLAEYPLVSGLSTARSLTTVHTATAAAQPAADRHIFQTDHFEIYYQPDLDLHAERVGQEAERAYEQVSADLKHDLPARVPVILFHTTGELEQSVQTGSLGGQAHAASPAVPSRMLLAMDHPADQWHGLITHEVAHHFLFDIVPGTATPRWITEGLAEYERGAWDPGDLAALREAVRANAIPQMSGLEGDGDGRNPRLVYGLGHAAFDFIESRWGKAGVRQFIFWLRQTANNGGDPYERALQVTRAEFDQAFEQHLRERFARFVGQSQGERFDYRVTIRIEGDISAINSPVAAGFACIELWVVTEGGIRRRWAVECGDDTEQDVLRVLRPGDRVIVTGPPVRTPAAQRMVMQSLERPSDGFTWRSVAVLGAAPLTAESQNETVYDTGNGVSVPAVVRQVKPDYTPQALDARIQGGVILDAIVRADGEVGDVKVRTSLDSKLGLDEQAVSAMKQWLFTPGLREGKPVAVRIQVEMTFALK